MRLDDVSAVEARNDLPQLLDQHQAEVWWYLRFLGCENALADDLTQETFLSVLKHPFEERNPRSTAAYLRRVARNLFVSHCRRVRREVEITAIQKAEVVWSTFEPTERAGVLLEALGGCLGRLGARARRAIEMRYREGADRAAIGRELGVSEEGAKKLLQRCLGALADCIERKVKP